MPNVKYSMKGSRSIFWHRRDLRIDDNVGLSKASNSRKKLTGVYVLDPKLLDLELTTSKSKNWFLGNSILELQNNWKRIGSRLLILSGDPIKLIPKLAELINVDTIFWNENIEPYEQYRDNKIKKELIKNKKQIYTFIDQLIIDPSEIRTNNNEPYRVYGAFYRKWLTNIYQTKLSNDILMQRFTVSNSLVDLNDTDLLAIKDSSLNYCVNNPGGDINSLLLENKFRGEHICPCKPGENASQRQLNSFINNGSIISYEKGRDIPSISGTSKLSAALSLGTISCRAAWNGSQISKRLATNQYQLDSINTWIKELAWREFYQNALINFPELAKGPYRKKWFNFPWQNRLDWYENWTNGLTGIPIIDAAMRQLKQSGWMHNRCRMIVASFLVKDLLIDWKWGETYFMKSLVDGDLASNNGGWQWSASSGMDTKPMRIFNPFRQASKFDPNGIYIRKWVPELAHISTTDLLSGEIAPLEKKYYPSPIINHKNQQAIFKELYSNLI